jgi:ribosomal-protein-alanine N-acetyltransferase
MITEAQSLLSELKDEILIDKEFIFKSCSNIIKQEVSDKIMGWIYRKPLYKSIEQNLFFYEVIENDIIGFCICRYLKKTKIITIDKIGVHQNFRKNNIGFKLLNKVKELNFPIILDVVESNKIAVNFYKKNEFKEIGQKILGKNIVVTIMKYK